MAVLEEPGKISVQIPSVNLPNFILQTKKAIWHKKPKTKVKVKWRRFRTTWSKSINFWDRLIMVDVQGLYWDDPDQGGLWRPKRASSSSRPEAEREGGSCKEADGCQQIGFLQFHPHQFIQFCPSISSSWNFLEKPLNLHHSCWLSFYTKYHRATSSLRRT